MGAQAATYPHPAITTVFIHARSTLHPFRLKHYSCTVDSLMCFCHGMLDLMAPLIWGQADRGSTATRGQPGPSPGSLPSLPFLRTLPRFPDSFLMLTKNGNLFLLCRAQVAIAVSPARTLGGRARRHLGCNPWAPRNLSRQLTGYVRPFAPSYSMLSRFLTRD